MDMLEEDFLILQCNVEDTPMVDYKYYHKELESCHALQINIPKMFFQETFICKGSPVSQPGLMDPFLVHGSSNRCVECT